MWTARRAAGAKVSSSSSGVERSTREGRTEVPRRDEPVAALVARPAADEDALVVALALDAVGVLVEPRSERVQLGDGLGDREAGELHELLRPMRLSSEC